MFPQAQTMHPNPLIKSQGLPGLSSKATPQQHQIKTAQDQVTNSLNSVGNDGQPSKSVKKQQQLIFEGNDREKKNMSNLSNAMIQSQSQSLAQM